MYLNRPATSCSSERAFKSTGFIFNEERSRLHTNNVERLVFIRENMHILPSEISILSQFVKIFSEEIFLKNKIIDWL